MSGFASCPDCGAVFEAVTKEDAEILKSLHDCPPDASPPEWRQRMEAEG